AFDHFAIRRNIVAGLDQNDIADLERGARHQTIGLVRARQQLAWLSVRVFFSDSACALPRPSATASAKLANSTVNHSQTMIWKVKPRLAPPVTRSRMKMTVVSAATISTTNITGLLIISRGSSLAKAEPIAGTTIFGSSIVAT